MCVLVYLSKNSPIVMSSNVFNYLMKLAKVEAPLSVLTVHFEGCLLNLYDAKSSKGSKTLKMKVNSIIVIID